MDAPLLEPQKCFNIYDLTELFFPFSFPIHNHAIFHVRSLQATKQLFLLFEPHLWGHHVTVTTLTFCSWKNYWFNTVTGALTSCVPAESVLPLAEDRGGGEGGMHV